MIKDDVIIANISGFYGDRFSAAKEMVEGGPVDFLTGDYLAELTIAILYKAKLKRPEAGYAHTFLKQMEGIMGTCLDKGVKVVVNAGGLNPSGLAEALKNVAKTLQVHPRIAYVEGDNLMPRLGEFKKEGIALKHLEKATTLRESGMMPLSANAYLGCWGIVEALNKGADIVVTGRVSDTSVVMGPAAYHFGWSKDNWDALAGAATAGHIIECSGQAAGGNYAFFEEVKSFTNVGFPIAEISSDGSSVITKHPGTGGLISTGTVTAQLLYEINAPEYITPDVVAHFDTIRLVQEGEDRVSVTGVKGSPATDTAKVTANCLGGFQNTMQLNMVGLDLDKKIQTFKAGFLEACGGEEAFDKIEFQYFKNTNPDPQSNEEAFSIFRISVIDRDAKKAGKFFTSKLIEMALCTIPGWSMSSAPGPARPRIVHFPALIDKKHLKQQVDIDGEKIEVDEVTSGGVEYNLEKSLVQHQASVETDDKINIELGRVYAARSGDKGGNANVGIWGRTAEEYVFLKEFLTVDKIKELLPDTAPFEIIRYDFANLYGFNFYIKGYLQDGVAASTKMDGQAKTLGEYLRVKKADIPKILL